MENLPIYYKRLLARSIAGFAIAAGEKIFSLAIFLVKPFANCVVIEKHRVCGLPPQEDALFVGTQWSHMLEHGKPGFCAAYDRH